MPRFRALVLAETEEPLKRTSLDADDVVGMASSGLSRGIAVYAIVDEELQALAASVPAGVVRDRGRKHPAKSLGDYLAGRPGVLRLSAVYHQPGQAARGLAALLAATRDLPVNGRYLIGLPRKVFEALWDRAPEDGGGLVFDKRRPKGAPSPAALQDLFSLHPELRIPGVVARSYVGDAPVVRLVHFLIVLAANCEFPVLIEGETGTGKEIVARQIHKLRFGADEKCISVNCGGIPSELLESELFGHARGAFTSATRNKTGLWKDADGGTLFLDEIGDLAPTHQVKVLRALEQGTFRPVGGEKEIRSRARVLAATHQNLEALMRAKKFREDLYHRLAVVRIRTPSLREHPEDVPAIARHLWPSLRLNGDQTLSDEICALLEAQPMPGNVRELRSILSELAMLSYGKPITMRMARIVVRDRRGGRDE